VTGGGSGEARWRELPAGQGAEGRAGEMVRRLGNPALPGDERLAAIRVRIRLRRGPRIVRRRFAPVLVVVALLTGTTLGLAASGWIEPLRERWIRRAVEPPVPAADPPRRRLRARRAEPAPVEEPPAVVAPALEPAPAPAAAPAPVPLRRPGPSIAPDAGPRRETALLATAIRKLRRAGDARGALSALDERAAAFPGGELAPEADLVRVEALLALGERGAALRLLDERADAPPRARQALLVRGELRAEAGRCADAARDLGMVLSHPPRDALDARALLARASCRSRLHDYAGARGDLEDYLRGFPGGPDAAQAAAALRAMP